ncbi:gamma-glutamyltransferase [Oxynema sp. CENA135]|uniref:gamma-glutamyltransferase n=1 Tax=Oxynema sp. CENA135 TaxID=984206 RepID=UPI00190C6E77|nr:gamma-glutamyltransferase [Oxynema sp. CENA135]MBK4731966.1 gamma-glutamyltransferase [Oxynema sp. CENA135]
MLSKTRGTIAAGHPKTAEAGIEMFRLGGNAFDAAVAAMLASFVVESGLTSVAGGGFLLARTRENRQILFDFFAQTPRHPQSVESLDFYPVDLDFGGTTQQFHIGLGSIAVPGNLAGLFAVHQQLGTLPFHVLAEPAIAYARQGVEINPFQSYLLNLLAPILLRDPASRQIYAPQGTLLQVGDTIAMPNLGTVFEEFAKTGTYEFYRGEIARQVVRDCQEKGGLLTLEDFENYRVILRSPLRIPYRDRQLLMNPPPSSGGALIAFTLKLLSTFDFDRFSFGSLPHLHALCRAMQLTNIGRKDGYDDSLYNADILDNFLSKKHLLDYQSQFQTYLKNDLNKLGSTTHISVLDCEGNAASVTTSNGEGSSYMIPGTDIAMNNMLGEADLNPRGFHRWRANCRMSSMMTPTVLMNGDRPEMVLGSGGSNRIRTAIFQVISNFVDFKMEAIAAVESPRTHYENGVFHLEPGLPGDLFDPPEFSSEFEWIYWQEKSMFFGGVHSVAIAPDGSMFGIGDSRRNGMGLSV